MNGHRIQMNGHQNKKQIGQNNHLQTLFSNHFYNLSNCKWFRWIVIEISSKLVETITSKHYLKIISFFCQIASDFNELSSKSKQIGQNNHLQTLFDTHSYVLYNWKGVHQNPITSKHYITLSKPNQAKSVREKKGRVSFENSTNGHFSACGIGRK